MNIHAHFIARRDDNGIPPGWCANANGTITISEYACAEDTAKKIVRIDLYDSTATDSYESFEVIDRTSRKVRSKRSGKREMNRVTFTVRRCISHNPVRWPGTKNNEKCYR